MEEAAYMLIREYGYPLLFMVILAGIIGFPLPDEGLLIYAGVLAAKGWLDPLSSFGCGVFAVLLGSLINYRVASLPRRRWLIRWGRKWGLSKKRIRTSLKLINRYGGWAVAVSYFVPGVRMGTAYTAGLVRLRLQTFAVGSFAGALVWVGFYLWIGWMLV
ncbi:membrane protein DedA with SNARE-associated domain [Melghirimyces profundicolus]|uniref:Membrane protein DedA with SNARE-associated domain n=1 Tax=Melghirimyces profundicolus TaxID=1242148 RepID=A0A2T6C7S5_9BACL|nr:DedA family protein [Melghirimyces profundicolus]PTX64374.1 membrane protein DedA with SNARE-associated domain [Melghirimyces profundicolus]